MVDKKEEIEKADVNIGLDDILKGAGNLINIVTKLKNEGESGIVNLEAIKDLSEKTKGLFGVTVKIGTREVSTIKKVIGRQPSEETLPTDKGVREPVTDVFEEKDYIEVIAELPGLEEKDIKHQIEKDTLTIYTVSDKRKYRKELPISFPVGATDIESSYKNGLLKLRLKRLT